MAESWLKPLVKGLFTVNPYMSNSNSDVCLSTTNKFKSHTEPLNLHN